MKIAGYSLAAITLLTAILLAGCSASSINDSSNAYALKSLEAFAPEQRYVIAVLPFEFKGGQNEFQGVGNRLVDMAVVELFNTKRFRIVERSRIDAVLGEISLGQMGITESQMADKIGKQVGAEMVMVGSITSVRPIQAKDTVGVAWRETRGFEVSLQGRLIDITRGEVVAVGQATESEAQTVSVAMGAQTGSIAPEETLLDKAVEKALKVLVNDFASNVAPKNS